LSCRRHNPEKGNIKMTSFRGLPPQLEGCSCYFSKSETDFKRDRYFFASGPDSIAYISINKKPVQLRRITNPVSSKENKPAELEETYSNKVYTVKIKLHTEGKSGDEVLWYTGKLKLFFKEVEVREFSVFGECGC